jgi:hypothetical protein
MVERLREAWGRRQGAFLKKRGVPVLLISYLSTCLVILSGDVICQLCIADVGVNRSFKD